MTKEEIDILWHKALRQSVEDGSPYARYRFAELVAEAEREKSLRLWMLLDDVDTADDIAKSDDAVYRSLCRQAHQKRWAVMTGDDVDAAIRARGQA